MIKYNHIFATSIVALCGVVGCNAHAAQNAPMVMSKYGEIQSVNKYSSNPFWTPNSPYNQRFPTPIYVTGPDLTSGDCNRIVQNLVSEYCTNRGNCSNLRIADVRPVVMVQLSQLPGHNFATSCGGYIDSIFENYKKAYGNVSTNNIVKPVQQKQNTIQIENPFKQTKTDYEIATDERTAELERMQRVTTAAATITPANFPKTVDDLSFTDRLANTTAGYEPYKNLNAYKTPKFETEDEYYERMKSVLTHTINYIGAGAKGCPATYLTGRGATVSCTPTRQNGTCTAWCTDATLTDCKTSFTISPNDRDDKTFYGKCTCNTGYKENGYKCVKPGTYGGGTSGGLNGAYDGGDAGGTNENPAPVNCPDEHMTFNPATGQCECMGKYVPDSSNANACVCANGLNLQEGCFSGYVLAQCRLKSPDKVKQVGDTVKKGEWIQRYLQDCENALMNHKILDRCFTPCKTNPKEKGYVNAIFEGAVAKGDLPAFCTGREGDMPVDFFMDASNFDTSIPPLLFNLTQKNAIFKGFKDFNGPVTQWAPGPRINAMCNDTKPRLWVLYALGKLSDEEYEVTDREVISHGELLQK